MSDFIATVLRDYGIRALGTLEMPLFCAMDVSSYICDQNGPRNFRENITQSNAIRWVMALDVRGQRVRMRFLTETGLYCFRTIGN